MYVATVRTSAGGRFEQLACTSPTPPKKPNITYEYTIYLQNLRTNTKQNTDTATKEKHDPFNNSGKDTHLKITKPLSSCWSL